MHSVSLIFFPVLDGFPVIQSDTPLLSDKVGRSVVGGVFVWLHRLMVVQTSLT